MRFQPDTASSVMIFIQALKNVNIDDVVSDSSESADFGLTLLKSTR